LYQHINQNNILATELYGYIKNSSTEKASLKLTNEILLVRNNKLTVGGTFWLRKRIWLYISWYTVV
jgi:hypothetical protein